ncbi:hypothetical protein Q4I32_000233, partial [Leishmania shawi]
TVALQLCSVKLLFPDQHESVESAPVPCTPFLIVATQVVAQRSPRLQISLRSYQLGGQTSLLD